MLKFCFSIFGSQSKKKIFRPKNAVQSIKKKLLSPNPHTAYYALLVLESVVKNCGSPIHDEIATRENCEIFTQLIESTPHENVKSKMLELIQAWAYAFRTVDKYQAVKVSSSVDFMMFLFLFQKYYELLLKMLRVLLCKMFINFYVVFFSLVFRIQ